MKSSRRDYIKDLLVPCLAFSALTGAFTAVIIFIFKWLASLMISLSVSAYVFFREKPQYLLLGVLASALIGALSALILTAAPNCRGGGIPTAVAVLRGLIPLKWIKSLVIMPLCALMSFLCGVPLGNEGPCVQMGTAIGNGTVKIFGKKRQAWSRYVMTGGACAGFSVATGAPITGMLFAVEEAHRRFSPLIFITASVSVTVSAALTELIGKITGTETAMFALKLGAVLPLRDLWCAAVIGLVCGISAIFFTRAYLLCSVIVKKALRRIPLSLLFAVIFAAVALMGFASADFIGSGHSLVETLAEGGGVWYLLIICFLVRAVLLMLSNNSGVTGGLFIPTLTFGAIIGALLAKAAVSLGILDANCLSVAVVIGMASFLAASSRTPISACTFAAEALGGFENILPIAVGVTVAYLVIEAVGVQSFNETVIESKLKMHNGERESRIFDTRIRVKEGSFAVGKEIRDILWPPTCVVLSVEKEPGAKQTVGLSAGDTLRVHYSTCYPEEAYSELETLVGKQDGCLGAGEHAEDGQHVPEL